MTTEPSQQQNAALEKQAYTVNEFKAAFGVSHNKFYDEVRSGRLRIRKMAKRTLVSKADAMAWLNSLPAAA